MPVIRSLVIAFATYSRIPMLRVAWSDENRKYAMCFFPLVGMVIGLVLWGWLWICERLALGGLLKGAVGALLPLVITGGIHMDGFMDTSDALASWQPPEKRLEILKDSHVGAFAVIHCTGYLLLTVGLLSETTPVQAPVLGAGFVVSRAMSAWTLAVFRSARKHGMLDGFARAAHRKMVTASALVYLLLCTLLCGLTGGWLVLPWLAAAGLCLVWYRNMAYKQFGGVTGDLAGWFVQVTEAVLLAVTVLGGKLI